MMPQPDPHPAGEGFSAEEFVRAHGWVHPRHEPQVLVSAAQVVSELLRWCHHAVLVSPERVLGDTERTVATVEALRNASASARQLFAHLASHVDPHGRGEDAQEPGAAPLERRAAGDHGDEADELAELSAMAAAEHFRNAALMAEGSVGFLSRAGEYMGRRGQTPGR